MTELAIIIVSHNTRADLERCLRSLASHPPRRSHTILVVDNASTDGSPVAVRSGWPHVRLLETGSNIGFARACNFGFRVSDSPLVLLLNSDTLVPDGALDRLTDALLAEPAAAVAGPRLVGGDGHVELSFGRMLNPLAQLRQLVRGALHARRVPPVSWGVERASRRRQFPDWVSGACLLVRRADAEAVGLLDERYFMYLEDVDFCAAIRQRGRRVLYTPAAEVCHLRGRSVASAPAAVARAYRQSQLAFYAKHRPEWLPLLRWYFRLRRIRLPG